MTDKAPEGYRPCVGLALFTILNLVVFVMVFINPEARSVVPIAPESTPDISTE